MKTAGWIGFFGLLGMSIVKILAISYLIDSGLSHWLYTINLLMAIGLAGSLIMFLFLKWNQKHIIVIMAAIPCILVSILNHDWFGVIVMTMFLIMFEVPHGEKWLQP